MHDEDGTQLLAKNGIILHILHFPQSQTKQSVQKRDMEQEIATQGVQGNVWDAGQRHARHIVTIGEPVPSLVLPFEGHVEGKGQFVALQKKYSSAATIYHAQANQNVDVEEPLKESLLPAPKVHLLLVVELVVLSMLEFVHQPPSFGAIVPNAQDFHHQSHLGDGHVQNLASLLQIARDEGLQPHESNKGEGNGQMEQEAIVALYKTGESPLLFRFQGPRPEAK